MSLRLLVLDAYDEAGRELLTNAACTDAGTLYARLLSQLEPDARVDVAAYGPRGFSLPAELDGFDGIVWTGSNLTVHRDTPAVRDQLSLVRTAFARGIPSFGSCWAVHIAVSAAGGRCEANPRGREFGIARKIRVTELAHPLYAGKAPVFDAFTSHEDHVVEVTAGVSVLAQNEFSRVQAVAVRHERGEFWAVQYHPEYELADLARLCVVRAPQLIAQGFLRDAADAERYMAELSALHADRERRDLAFRLAIDADVLDFERRTPEVKNWLDRLVKAHRRR